MFEDMRIYPNPLNFTDSDLKFLLNLERLLGYAFGVRQQREEDKETEPNKIKKSEPVWVSVREEDKNPDDYIDCDTEEPHVEKVDLPNEEPHDICIKSPIDDGVIEKKETNKKDDQIPVSREHPFVFISNRLTFLIKTRYPIIWDTSVIVESDEDCVFVALDKSKNPLIDMKESAKLSMYINSNPEIQKEIKEFLDGTKWSGIVCSPYRMAYNGESRFGFLFTLIEE